MGLGGESARNGRALTEYVETHLLDVEERIALMDKTGVERAILSLTSPGVQSILDTETAVRVARDTNDTVRGSYVDKYPGRLSMFACLPTQDAGEAAAELERAVRDLGAVGALINGYTNIGDNQTGRYLDDPSYAPLWAKIAELDVPVYLHPREPLPAQARIYEGYSSLVGSAWGFAHETATHAVRLMLSGLFDEHPGIQIILGHLGEGLPFLLPRLEHRLDKQREGWDWELRSGGSASTSTTTSTSPPAATFTPARCSTPSARSASTASCSQRTIPMRTWRKQRAGSTPRYCRTTTW